MDTARFRLSDDSSLFLSREQTRDLYEELWRLAAKPGAVSAAAKVAQARRANHQTPQKLNERESDAFRVALARIARGKD